MKSNDVPTVSESESQRTPIDAHRGRRVASTQFRVLDLFTVITLAAVAFAILVPALPYVSFEQLMIGIAAVAMQLISAVATFIALGIRRKRMMARTGERIGVAFSGEIPWKHWPVFRCCLTLAMAGLAQFVISFFFIFKMKTLYSPILLIYSLQLGYFFGASLSRFHWRSYPGVVEFFEAGVTTDGRSLTPWNRVEARESKIYKDRIVLVSDATNIAGSRSTQTVQVDDRLRQALRRYVNIESEQQIGPSARLNPS